jgi:gliding motility-associated-like protein
MTAAFDQFELSDKEGNMFLAKFGPTPLPEPPPVAEETRIPNIITPNNDDLNDTFAPHLPGPTADLQVYNRWSQLVYEQANYQNTWNGNNLATGTYYYVLTSATGQIWRGWVEISR